MKTILVSGGAGFIGSHIAEALLRAGHRVVILDNLQGGDERNVPHGANFIFGDITDEACVARIFEHIRIHAVVHGAAFASENLSNHVGLHTHRSIVIGTQVLLNAAVNHGCEAFVNLSSIAVYGEQIPPFVESVPPTPLDFYGAAKACAESCVKAATLHFGMPHVIFRPHNVIGTKQSLADSTRNVASIFIRQALSGKSFTVFGDGNQTRAFSPVSKVAAIIAASVDRPSTWNQTFNVGGDRVMTVMRLAYVVAEKAGVDVNVDLLPARKEVAHAHSYHEAVRLAFPDLAELPESIEETIAEMIAEAKLRPLPKVKRLPRIEVAKNLNPAWTFQP